MNLKRLLTLATATMAVVKGFETECNYFSPGYVAYATDLCMTYVLPDVQFSQMYRCQSDNITLERWLTSTTCDGTPSTVLDLAEIVKELNITAYLWKCDGQKATEDCSYMQWNMSTSSDNLCTDVQAHYTMYLLNDICLAHLPSETYTSTSCGGADLMLARYSDPACTDMMNSSTQTSSCIDGEAQNFECYPCGIDGCSTVMPSDLVTTGNTMTTDSMTDTCSYVQLLYLYAVDQCMAEVTEAGTVSRKFVCDPDTQTPVVHVWQDSASCVGDPEIQTMEELADMYGIPVELITWNCQGTKSLDQCNYAHAYIYTKTDSCAEDEYREIYTINDVCGNGVGYSTRTTCSDSTIQFYTYEGQNCVDLANQSTIETGCFEDAGKFENNKIICFMGMSSTDISSTDVSSTPDASSTPDVSSTPDASSTSAGTTTTSAGTTTTSAGATTTSAGATTTANASPANFFVYSQIWSIVVGAFSFVLLFISI